MAQLQSVRVWKFMRWHFGSGRETEGAEEEEDDDDDDDDKEAEGEDLITIITTTTVLRLPIQRL